MNKLFSLIILAIATTLFTPNTAKAEVDAKAKAKAICANPPSDDNCKTVCNAFNAAMMQAGSVLAACKPSGGGKKPKATRNTGGGGGRRKAATKKMSAKEVEEVVDQKLSGKFVLDWDAETTSVIVLVFGILNALLLFLFWRKNKKLFEAADQIRLIAQTADQAQTESLRTKAALLYLSECDPQIHQAVQAILAGQQPPAQQGGGAVAGGGQPHP